MTTTIPTPYEDLLRDVLANGTKRSDRTGTGTVGVFGRHMRFDLAQGFPLITTKKVYMPGVIAELLWFLDGDTRLKTLQDQYVKIWDEWVLEDGTIGPGYGHQWRHWDSKTPGVYTDQIQALMEGLKEQPFSRRHIVNAWNVDDIHRMALPPCHLLFQFHVTPDEHGNPWKLNCMLTQRSGDMFLGVPFNIASYAALTSMVAQQIGLEVGEFVHSIGDAHIYLNHLDQVHEQLAREPRPYPQLVIKRKPETIFDYKIEDFEVLNYDPHPKITAPVAV